MMKKYEAYIGTKRLKFDAANQKVAGIYVRDLCRNLNAHKAHYREIGKRKWIHLDCSFHHVPTVFRFADHSIVVNIYPWPNDVYCISVSRSRIKVELVTELTQHRSTYVDMNSDWQPATISWPSSGPQPGVQAHMFSEAMEKALIVLLRLNQADIGRITDQDILANL